MEMSIEEALEYLTDFSIYSPYQGAIDKVSAYIEQMQSDYENRLKADMVDIKQLGKSVKTLQKANSDIAGAYDKLKTQYENRLKADLKAILVELQLEIEELCIDTPLSESEEDMNRGIELAADAIQQKINELKAESEATHDV